MTAIGMRETKGAPRGRSSQSAGDPGRDFDFAAPAEIFMTRAKRGNRNPFSYRRFTTAAEAIQFAVEQIPAPLRISAVMEVQEERYDHRGIRHLYDGDAYPLERMPVG